MSHQEQEQGEEEETNEQPLLFVPLTLLAYISIHTI